MRPVPRMAALLLRVLFPGEEGEFVAGDIQERWAGDVRDGRSDAGRRLARQILRSAVRWWSPARAWDRWRRENRNGRGEGMTGWIQDVRVAGRGLRKRPGLVLAVLLTIGLGIGATTTIWSVVDGVLLRPLPFHDPDRIVVVGTTFSGREWADIEAGRMHLAGTSMLNYQDLRARARTLAPFGALEATSVLLAEDGSGPELARAARVDPAFFGTLGVDPALGRLFTPEEAHDGRDTGIILSHAAWTERFGGSPDILGRTVGAPGSSRTVVGVLPEGFKPPEAILSPLTEFYLPLTPDHPRYAERGSRTLVLLARLAPGASLEQARVELDGIADELAAEHPEGNVHPDGTHLGAGANTLLQETVGGAGRLLGIFLGAAGLLLLIAIMNTTGLLLARGLDRTRELGIRAALGAGHRRLVRLMLVEGTLLAAAGGVAGMGLAVAGVKAFHALGPDSLPRLSQVAVDGRVLLVSTLLSVAVGIASSLVPALRLVPKAAGLPGAPRSAGESRGTARLRGVLVSVQVGMAVVLMAGAGLLFHSFLRLQWVDPGFDATESLAFRVSTKRPGAPDGEEPWQAWASLLEEVSAVPGVSAATASSDLPFQPPSWAPRVLLEGEADDTPRHGVAGYAVTPGYLESVGTRLLAGRGLEEAGSDPGLGPVLVNEAFVHEVLGDGSAVGTGLRISEPGQGDGLRPVTVVGVVENVVQARPEEGARPAVYLLQRDAGWPYWVNVVVESARPMDGLVPDLRRAVARVQPVVPIQDVATLEVRRERTRSAPRFQMLLLVTFAAVALALAVTGLYGTLAHSVGRRRAELGVRMALGADRTSLMGTVLGQSLRLVGLGLVLGLAGALGLQRVLAGFLFEVVPLDPATFVGVLVVLILASTLASLLPARRAAGVDPVEVLQAD